MALTLYPCSLCALKYFALDGTICWLDSSAFGVKHLLGPQNLFLVKFVYVNECFIALTNSPVLSASSIFLFF